MTSLLGARRRAEEFAAAVDTPHTPPASPDLAELVELVAGLRAQEAPAPRAEFTASLRERLLAEADEILVQDAALTLPRRRTGARERRLAVAASAFVLVGGSAGLAAAAQNSLPGDALYPIKRGIESAHTGLTTNHVDKGRDLLGQADSRLTEVQQLLAQDSSTVDEAQVPGTIRDFAVQAQQGSQLLLDSYSQQQDPKIVDEVRSFTSRSLDTLAGLAKVAPPEEQRALAEAAMVLKDIDTSAARACSTCASGAPVLRLPPTLLASAEVDRALGALEKKQPNNDHPVLGGVPKTGPQSGKGGDQGGKGGTGTSKGGTDNGDGTTDGDGTGPSVEDPPKAPGGVVTGGGLHKGLKHLKDKVGGKGDSDGGTKKVLKDPLDPILKSLLP